MLLVHGWGARASRFADLVSALLAGGYSPVAYDAWGHGATPGPVRTIPEHRVVIDELERRHGASTAWSRTRSASRSRCTPYATGSPSTGSSPSAGWGTSATWSTRSATGSACGRRSTASCAGRSSAAYFDGDTGIWERFSARPMAGREVLVIHDAGDTVVDRGQADLLVAALDDGVRLVETVGLGHGRILRDPAVIAETVAFSGREVS